MVEARDDLLSSLLHLGEREWIEFKVGLSEPEVIGKYISALANAAAYDAEPFGYLVWGIRDDHGIVGTHFDPHKETLNKQPLQLWLAQFLKPSVPFDFWSTERDGARIVVMRVAAPTQAPVTFRDIPYVRIQSATPKLTDFPDRYAALIERIRPYAWEHGVAAERLSLPKTLSLIDDRAYLKLMGISAPSSDEVLADRLVADGIVTKSIDRGWCITNLGAILFARDLGDFGDGIQRKGVRIVAYGGPSRANPVTNRMDERRGYANGFRDLIEQINFLLPKQERIGGAFREELRVFPEIAVRELVANALIHQDMTISGAGPLIEVFPDRLEVSNPGRPLIEPDRMFDLPPKSRNQGLAKLMRRMKLCEEQGSGLDKVLVEVESHRLGPPLLRASDSAMQVILYGPRTYTDMTAQERGRACQQHTILKWLNGQRMKNATLCTRLGIDPANASQASGVIRYALDNRLIKPADPDHPRAGYVPTWA